jgi:hypothetical protein
MVSYDGRRERSEQHMTAGRVAVVAVGAVVIAVAAKKAKKRVKAAAGVYIEEVSSGARPIEAVGTAVAAFVGLG